MQRPIHHCRYATLLLVITGCINTQVTKLTNQTYPNVDPEEVVVYVTPNDVTGDYEKIGIIHAQGEDK